MAEKKLMNTALGETMFFKYVELFFTSLIMKTLSAGIFEEIRLSAHPAGQ